MSNNIFKVDSPELQLPSLINNTSLAVLSFSQSAPNNVTFTFNKTINRVLFAQVITNKTDIGTNVYTLNSTVSGKTITFVTSETVVLAEQSTFIKLNVTATDGSMFVGIIPFSSFEMIVE